MGKEEREMCTLFKIIFKWLKFVETYKFFLDHSVYLADSSYVIVFNKF